MAPAIASHSDSNQSASPLRRPYSPYPHRRSRIPPEPRRTPGKCKAADLQQPKRSAEVESARGYGGKQKPGLGAEKQAHAIARKIPEGQIARVLAERNNPSFLAAAVQAKPKGCQRLGNAPAQRRAATEPRRPRSSAFPVLTALAVGAALQFARFAFPLGVGRPGLSPRIFQLSQEGP